MIWTKYNIAIYNSDIKIVEIVYLDNSKRTMKDLKNYICDIMDYNCCPCKISLYNKVPSYNRFYEKIYEKRYLKFNDNDLLVTLGLKSSFNADIESNKKCDCSSQEKKYFKESKETIKKLLIEADEKKIILEKKINELKETIWNLKDSISKMEKEENKAKDKIKNLNKEKEILENDKYNLLKENKDLKMALKENPDTLKRLHDLGYFKNIKAADTSTQMDSKTGKLKPSSNLKKTEFKGFYDVVINITSVKNISQGWVIEMSEKGEKNFNKYKNQDLLRLGVIGNSNKGKSFILSRISKIELASGYYINTKGLSIKYPELDEYTNRKIVLLDSAGLETPVLNDSTNDENNQNDKQNEYLSYEGDANDKSFNGKYPEVDTKKDNNNETLQENDKKRNIFMEKSKEKLITELFLQKYIILNSDILILVVGILTYSEQKLINKILDEIKNLNVNKKIFIIHNLKELFTKEQVEDYIKNTLLKSVTFKLVERQNIDTEYTKYNNSKYGRYFVEKNDKNNKNNTDIFHLIFANEDSEAGKIYNKFALEFIEKSYQSISNIRPFDVIKTLKTRFLEHSKDFIENNNDIEKKIVINDDDDIIKSKIIKLKDKQEITLKRCLIDEFGLWNLKKNGFEPKYNCYIKENKLIVKVEVPGNCTINSIISKKGELTIIKIEGNKLNKKEESYILNTRVFGDFNFEIILRVSECEIKNQKPKISGKNGIITLEFECEDKAEKAEFKIGDDDN